MITQKILTRTNKVGECLIWNGAKTRNKVGYGCLRINGKKVLAHRIIWEHEYGVIPDNMRILHKCDNSLCVNINHLFLGTQGDNIRDMFNKHRDKHNPLLGEKHPNSKLTKADILQIYQDKRPQRKIAEEFKIGQPTVHKIKKGIAWRHMITLCPDCHKEAHK